MTEKVLNVENLSVSFRTPNGLRAAGQHQSHVSHDRRETCTGYQHPSRQFRIELK
jgi:hypothetical protein